MFFFQFPPYYIPLVLLALLSSVILHEIAHGLVAKWNGDLTAKYAGRLTANPVKHFDVVGISMLLLAGFGYAKPVPVNPANFKDRDKGMYLVSSAGIITNIILMVISAFFAVIIERFGPVGVNAGIDAVYFFFVIMALVNATLAVFNLLPFFPLDGHRIVETATGPMNKATKWLRDYGPPVLFITAIVSILFMGLAMVWPIMRFFSPFGLLMNYVGGGLRQSVFNLFRLMFGVEVQWVF